MIAGLLVALCMAAVGPRVQAQSGYVLDPGKALTQYIHQAWQADEGLPQSTVGAIIQTSDGYLWLGTEEGLVRFDGIRFTVFSKHNTAVFEAGQAIETLLEDPEGNLWIGTVRAGLVRYTDGTFTRYAAREGLPAQEISTLFHDRQTDVLWVGTRDAGLFTFRDGRFEPQFVEQLASDHVSAVLRDQNGTLWVGTQKGLHRLDGGASTLYRHADGSDAFVMALHEDRAGTLWVGTRTGLSRLSHGELRPYSALGPSPHQAIRALWEDHAGTLWVGMEGGGLGRLHAGRFETFTAEDGLTHDWVLALYGDREGSLWIGTEAGGLNRLWDGKFTTYSTREGLSHDVVTAVYEDPNGTFWIGTDGGGLNRLRGDSMTVLSSEDGLSGNIITSLVSGADGALWVGTLRDGLTQLDGDRTTVLSSDDGLPSNHVYALYSTADGALWIGTDAGLARLRDGRFKTYTTEDGLSSNLVTAILEDATGTLWVGTYDGGLSRLRDGRFETYTTEDGLSSNLVLTLYEDDQGVLWVGTYEGGLARIQEDRLDTFTTRDGLFDDNVYAILEDHAGRLWMSCNKGLFTVSKKDLEAFARGLLDHVVSTVYGKSDGLKSPEMNGGAQPAAWRRRDGTLWFPTLEGVAGIDPGNIRRNLRPPPVVVEELLVDNEPVALQGGLEVGAGTKKLDFRFTALSFVAPENLLFRYFLEGYDTDWQETSTGRTAVYTNLPPGAYTFRVMARNSDGVWSEAEAAVSFRLSPFFYQTVWFYALCLLTLLLLVFGGYRFRIRHLKARERELQAQVIAHTEDLRMAKEQIEAQAERLVELDRFKTRFFANVSHEFRTPLTMIVGPLENALAGSYGTLDGSMQRQVEIMLRNALRLMRLINQLLDLSKLEAGKMALHARPRNLAPFIEGVVLSFTAFAEQKGIQLTFHTEQPETELYYEPDKLEKVFYNLLSNAVKFTPAGGAVTVDIGDLPPCAGMPDGAVRIVVTDTGKGIPAKELPFIFDRFRQVDGSNTREHEGTGIGLALVRELVLLHHGTIEAESEPGRGTTFVIMLPKGNAHLKQDEVLDAETDDYLEPEHGAMAELAFSALGFMPENELPPSNGHQVGLEAGPETPLVLVVEDNADVREYVGGILGLHYRVAMARDGADGLEQARSLEPDLIVSDVMMPRMDGNELCRAVKADPELATVPVILLTARATQATKIEGLEVGADDYLSKPFNARELMARTRNLLRLRQQEKALKRLNATLEGKVKEQVDLILSERLHYEQQLVAAKDQAESSLRLKTAILDNLNHEFRTPLAIIQGYAQVLSKEVPNELQEFTFQIDQSGDRLMRTLDAVHQLSRLESENIDLTTTMLDLGVAVREAQRQFADQAARKQLRLRLDVPRAPVMARLDSEALRRILDHLLDNAIKFTDEGEVFVQVTRVKDEAVLRVQDTGIGIAEEFLPHLFDAFTQESTGLTRTHSGIGLGLTLTRRLVELLGGDIDVESTKGRGSVFIVRFPASEVPVTGPPMRNAAQKPA